MKYFEIHFYNILEDIKTEFIIIQMSSQLPNYLLIWERNVPMVFDETENLVMYLLQQNQKKLKNEKLKTQVLILYILWHFLEQEEICHKLVNYSFDCGTQNGIYLNDLILSKNKKNLFPLKQRLLGRIIANNSRIPIKYRNKEISHDFIEKKKNFFIEPIKVERKNDKREAINNYEKAKQETLGEMMMKKKSYDNRKRESFEWSSAEIAVRSPLTCEASPTPYLCCQLTLRTFHTGGIYSEKMGDFKLMAPFDGNIIIPNFCTIKKYFHNKEMISTFITSRLFNDNKTGKMNRIFYDEKIKFLVKNEDLPRPEKNKRKANFKKFAFPTPRFHLCLQKIVNNVQSVYRGQGVEIYDQHIEVLISQMGSKIRIKEKFYSKFFWNEVVPLTLIKDNTEIDYEPILSGITKISLQSDSFISAASFQNTSKILSRESLKKSKDFLFGLKESIIVNELIPSGTGILIIS
uniref:RNA polymerase beta'-subunit n=1 Tax=Cephaleuros karstenii TaxID=1985640 RepID=UPI001EDE1890|nr:RNA polymerase beta'-subunit [Cephaleuros karstenii]UIB39095.1 RNA polymerase beta'-subunit [Cephaleuros karstenii]